MRKITNKLITEAKMFYFKKLGEKLSHPQNGPKYFCSAFKRITSEVKHANIPPLLENDMYAPNFQQKANIFNNYFAAECKIIDNGSMLPIVYYKTNESNNEVNISMLQLCASEVAIPFQIMFKNVQAIFQIPGSMQMYNLSIRKAIVK